MQGSNITKIVKVQNKHVEFEDWQRGRKKSRQQLRDTRRKGVEAKREL